MSCAAVLGLALGSSGTARADASDDAYQAGVGARRERKDAEALSHFRRAYSLRPTAKALAQAGLAEQALGRWLDAERDVVRALESKEDPWIVSNLQTLQSSLIEIRNNIGAVDLSSDQADVELWVDGALVAKLPYTLRAGAGVVEVELRAKGQPALRRRLEVTARRTVSERVHLEPAAAPTASAAREPAPSPPLASPPPPRERATPPAPTSIAPSRSIWPWVTLGGAVVLVAGGATAHVVREQAAARYNDDSRCAPNELMTTRDERCGSDRSTARAGSVLAVVGYAGGALLGGLTAYLWLSDGKTDSGPRARLQAGPEHALLTYGSSF
jgi:hypothetical protein